MSSATTIFNADLIECPKCGTPVEKPEGYNPKARTNKEKENNPKVHCHFC
jgi:hypothetical protein